MKKTGIILAAFLVIAMILILQPVAALKQGGSHPQYTPSKEFTEYLEAPVITQEQKDLAQKVIETSDIFQKYSNSQRSEITYQWAYPYTGTIHASMVIDSSDTGAYGLLWYDIDSKGNVVKSGFSNWMKYW